MLDLILYFDSCAMVIKLSVLCHSVQIHPRMEQYFYKWNHLGKDQPNIYHLNIGGRWETLGHTDKERGQHQERGQHSYNIESFFQIQFVGCFAPIKCLAFDLCLWWQFGERAQTSGIILLVAGWSKVVILPCLQWLKEVNRSLK